METVLPLFSETKKSEGRGEKERRIVNFMEIRELPSLDLVVAVQASEARICHLLPLGIGFLEHPTPQQEQGSHVFQPLAQRGTHRVGDVGEGVATDDREHGSCTGFSVNHFPILSNRFPDRLESFPQSSRDVSQAFPKNEETASLSFPERVSWEARFSWGAVTRSLNCSVTFCPDFCLFLGPPFDDDDWTGPIGRTVSDAVYLLDVIVGYDPRDEITKKAAQYIPSGGYKKFLKTDGLNGKRLGNLWHYFKGIYENSPISDKFQQHFDTMTKNGACLINDLKISDFETVMNASEEVLALKYEFKRDLSIYLSNLLKSEIRSLADAISFNEANPDLEKLHKYGQTLFIESEKTTLPNNEYTEAVDKLMMLSKEGFEKFMTDNNLDAMVAPEAFGAGILAAGGYPGIVVPAGFKPDGVPFGILFGGLRGSDATLIEIAYAFEQATKIRKPPTLPT
ncbi:hypothetical protein HHK36_002966 [Tetracentron sinense]|uniref:Amidase domain-containing protein n=1 Tax=Tetracentron sinense TaxID=13715 RepID=A0A834ZXG5_TETSI|nr:hypothetical protein HHK36_002966 [Tetracentron sinense]